MLDLRKLLFSKAMWKRGSVILSGSKSTQSAVVVHDVSSNDSSCLGYCPESHPSPNTCRVEYTEEDQKPHVSGPLFSAWLTRNIVEMIVHRTLAD